MRITYKSAGVDIDKANKLVTDYKRFAKSTATKGVMSEALIVGNQRISLIDINAGGFVRCFHFT